MNAVRVHRDMACAAPGSPARATLQRWVTAALHANHCESGEVTLRIVDEAEMAALNRDYRGRTGATNVLSFPAEDPLAASPRYLGDIVITAAVVAREAREQGKPTRAHWAHLVVHGVLHLLGHDHVADRDAEHMEKLEREILADLGYADPYA